MRNIDVNFIDEGKVLHKTLIEMLQYSRFRSLEYVINLSKIQLDFIDSKNSNSIGILLRHIAALEYLIVTNIFEKRQLLKNELEYWNGSLPGELYLKKVNGNDINYYLLELKNVRDRTFTFLEGVDDSWLNQISPIVNPQGFSNFTWLFHLIEDEFSHLGQIKLLILKQSELNIIKK